MRGAGSSAGLPQPSSPAQVPKNLRSAPPIQASGPAARADPAAAAPWRAEAASAASNWFDGSNALPAGEDMAALEGLFGDPQAFFASYRSQARGRFGVAGPMPARSLDWYRALPADAKKAHLMRIGRINDGLSWTAALGRSRKDFLEPEGIVQEKARANMRRADAFVLKLAKARFETPLGLAAFVTRLNRIITRGLVTVTRDSRSVAGKAGDLRRYPTKRETLGGRSVDDIPGRLEDFASWLFARVDDPGVDPVELAAQAHLRLSDDIKAFHDGNGRTARAVVQWVLSRRGYPWAKFAGDINMRDQTRTAEAEYMEALRGGAASLRGYLDRALNHAQRDILEHVSTPETPAPPPSARIGEGLFNTVYRLGPDLVVKTAKNLFAQGENLREAMFYRWVKRLGVGLAVAPFIAFQPDGRAIVKKFIEGPTGSQVLLAGGLSEEQERALRRAYESVRRVEAETSQVLDFKPKNVVWNGGEWVIVDLGLRSENFMSHFIPWPSYEAYRAAVWTLEEALDSPPSPAKPLRQGPPNGLDLPADETAVAA